MKEHSDIFLGPKNTIRFFERPCYEERDWNWYLGCFEGARDGQLIGEARVEYLYNPESSSLIHRHLPRCKLIFQLRDPVERAVSACLHNIRRGNFPNQSVEDSLRQAVGVHGGCRAGAQEELLRRVIEMGFYAEQLERYLQYFPLGRILILLHDDIVRDPLSCVRASCHFLGVPEFRPKRIRSRPMKSSGFPSVTGLEMAMHGIPGSTRVWDWSNRILARIAGGTGHPPLSAGLRATLDQLYAPHNRRLSGLLEAYRRSGETVTEHFAPDWPAWVAAT